MKKQKKKTETFSIYSLFAVYKQIIDELDKRNILFSHPQVVKKTLIYIKMI